MLPFQVVERVQFGHHDLEPNRLFWGDNLHVMRQLPGESIDLIYIDPPFFSGKQYNVIFGDQNELRSFSDIWEGGLPGYLIWLNARLYEMKRLLKKTGSINVHCDWHASHYVKVEMDKIFGHDKFMNEVVWHYGGRGAKAIARKFPRNHDVLLFYTRDGRGHNFERQYLERQVTLEEAKQRGLRQDEEGRWFKTAPRGDYTDESVSRLESEGRIHRTRTGSIRVKYFLKERAGVIVEEVLVGDTWQDIPDAMHIGKERIGYPTQKPEALLERIIKASTNEGDTVADFFCGGGTTAAVAQRLGRRWIAGDQSRVAVAIAADRLTQQVEERAGRMFAVPDFTVEHWGVYEAQRLSEAPPEQFRAFVLRCFGARDAEQEPGIHGYKGAVPIWVGDPDQSKGATASDVQAFANAIRKTLRYRQDNLRDGSMLAWAFRPDAVEAADRLRRLEQTDLNFIRLDMIRIDSPRFREHVAALSTEHADYENFLTFVQPPRVEVGFRRIAPLTYDFDVSDTIAMNPGAKIINVQWDFNYGERFSSTPGYSFVRGGKKEPALQAQYKFPGNGKRRVGCRVQDDMGGEGLGATEIEVS